MKTIKSKVVFLLLFISLMWGGEGFFAPLSGGFSLTSISSSLPYQESWNLPFSDSTSEQVKEIVSQEFFYLASGSQSDVFMSKDGQYVIKFFKHKRWRLHPLVEKIPLPPPFNQKRARWKKKKKETVESTFESCLFSYKEFKEETGVIFLHLNQTEKLRQQLLLSDRLTQKHRIDLDKVQFVLQKRAVRTDRYLMNLYKNKELDKMQKAISLLIDFVVRRAEKGYSDKDPHFVRNFGFIDDQVVEIDVGGFHRDKKKDLYYFYSHELVKIRDQFLPWVKVHFPELLAFTEEEFVKKGAKERDEPS